MGVTGAHDWKRKASAALNERSHSNAWRNHPKIERSFATISESVAAARALDPTKPLLICVDVFSHFGHLMRKLPGEAALKAVRQPDGEGGSTFETAATEIFRSMLGEALAELRTQLQSGISQHGDKLFFVFDNGGVVAPAKLETYIARRQKKAKSVEGFRSGLEAYRRLQSKTGPVPKRSKAYNAVANANPRN